MLKVTFRVQMFIQLKIRNKVKKKNNRSHTLQTRSLALVARSGGHQDGKPVWGNSLAPMSLFSGALLSIDRRSMILPYLSGEK